MFSLLPSTGRARTSSDAGPTAPLDVVHDHVLRLVGDRDAARRITLDVVLRATARHAEAGEAATLPVLLRLARARVAGNLPRHLDAAWLVSLVPPRDPAARVVASALGAPAEPAASLLDLTVRHGVDTRTAATALGLDPRQAAAIRADALRQVRVALADDDIDVDVEATLAGLPLVPAPAALHDQFAARRVRRVPHGLAWLAPPAAVVVLTAAVLAGLPDALAGATDSTVPLVTAEPVADAPALLQLRADGDGMPGPTDEVVLPSRPAADDGATDSATSPDPGTASPDLDPDPEPGPTAAPDPTPSPQPTPTPDPSPSPEPTDDPLGDLLPTGP